VIVDVSNKAAPTLAGRYDTAGSAGGVAVAGNYAHVTNYYNGLEIVDVCNKAAPTLAGRYETAGSVYGVAVAGDYAYVANGSAGLEIVDVSNKAAPALAGRYDTAGWAYGVAVADNYAYVADDYNGLVILRAGTDTTSPTASFTYSPEKPVVNQTITFNASDSIDPDGTIVKYDWDFGDGNSGTGEVITHAYSSAGDYTVILTVTDNDEATDTTSEVVKVYPEVLFFDTGAGSCPSISGIHEGTITLNKTLTVHKMYTYPCAGTGGHTEYVRFSGTGLDVNKTWSGYSGDYLNITFEPSITLYANMTYNYEIRTGSYPQIIHAQSNSTANGTINCTQFTDANGRIYDNWIPAILLE